MPFHNHVFISYAHKDNKKAHGDDMGWVESFSDYLNLSLTLNLGADARIWRDEKLAGNDQFGPEIEDQFQNSAVLVAVVSKSYLNSEWCRKEVDEFCEAAAKNGGLTLSNKARVFRVLMRSIEYEKLKVFHDLQDATLVYPFYTEIKVDNQGKGGSREIRLDPRLGKGEDFRMQVEMLSDDIVSMIEQLEGASPEITANQTTDMLTVYLAECSYDLRSERDRLFAELRKHGYRVLPDEQLPSLESEYIQSVTKCLERCDLAIHLIGSAYGSVPDGPSGKSATILQNELAATSSRATGLKRLIWMPNQAKAVSEEQAEFLKKLQNDAELQFGADLVSSDFETLKSTMHAQLQAKAQANQISVDPHEQQIVYLVCDARDRKTTIPLRKYLKGKGFEVFIPVFEAGSAEELRKANEKQMQDCDAVILWYGEGDEAWHATMESDLRRARSLRGGRDFKACYTYLAGPATDDKNEMVEMEESNLINGLAGEEFNSAALSDFEKDLAESVE